MFSSRKEIEELEARIECVLNSQIETREALSPLQANIERLMNEGLNLLSADVSTGFETQTAWQAKAFKSVVETLQEGITGDKAKVLSAIAALSAKSEAQFEALQSLFINQIGALEAKNQILLERIEEFQFEWQESVAFEIRDESSEVLEEWCAEIADRLRGFDKAEGMPRAFAHQLFQTLKKLRALHADWEGAKGNFASHLDELQRVLFTPDAGLSWNALTSHNSTPTQRKSLRALETAIAQLRGTLQEKLRRETGIAPLEIVPMLSRFDARQHETNEFLEVPTGDASRHNLILSVERPGFQKTAPDGQTTLLQVARVRRYVLDQQIAPLTPAPRNTEETAQQPNEESAIATEKAFAEENLAPALNAAQQDVIDEPSPSEEPAEAPETEAGIAASPGLRQL